MRHEKFGNRVVKFLKEFKLAFVKNGLLFVPRKSNLNLLAHHGISVDEVEATVLGLTAANHTHGPVKAGDTYETCDFGAQVGGEKFDFRLRLALATAPYLSLPGSGEAHLATISLRSHVDAQKQDLRLREVRAYHRYAG